MVRMQQMIFEKCHFIGGVNKNVNGVTKTLSTIVDGSSNQVHRVRNYHLMAHVYVSALNNTETMTKLCLYINII